MPPFRSRKPNQLTREGFDRLLHALHDDMERAAEEYENIRQALVAFFEFRGSFSAQEDADEVMDRVARRLAEGREIFADKPRSYFYAVARFVWRERLASPYKETTLEDTTLQQRYRPPTPHELLERAADRQQQEQRLNCLAQCLGKLAHAERELIETYYQGDGRDKIENRQMLAQRLGVPLSALRLRAFRLREKLETCVTRCMRRS